ncbi:FAD-dependent monooxygenase [Hydrogenovibrio kuenenii]|uniref:FAD-dependent monooxygenase n=1 Tax=Hydrogenovibrio kuenenii TaxID=63658 RepID=UPI0004656D22|nr:FAD-dependent monooxygenase [Hydrogenovibrio kuenenii]
MSKAAPSEAERTSIDAFINGGGPVGLILAIGLAAQNRQVVLVEKSLPKKGPSFDGRVLALSYGSRLVLEQLGIWQKLEPYVTEILDIHVSQKGFMGVTHLHASEVKVPALGYSVTAFDLGQVLWEIAQQTQNIQLFTECSLEGFEQNETRVSIDIQCSKNESRPLAFDAKILVGADGTYSKVREVLKLSLEESDYGAFGFIAKIETELNPNGWAFERFTSEGPVALLPMGGHFHKAVMVVPSAKMDEVKALSDDEFIARFTEKMGERLGRFVSVSERVAYPLKETYVPQMVVGRAVLMGNASHTQHPVAAQGLNLGISDIQAFLSAVEAENDLGNAEALLSYQTSQQTHHQKIMGFTDSLIQVFQAPSSVVGHMRGIGLMAMEAMPSLRKRLSKMAMGLAK